MKKIVYMGATALLLFLLVGGSAVAAGIRVEQGPKTVVVPLEPERVVVFDYGVLDVLANLSIDVVGLPKGSLPAYLGEFKADQYADVGTLFEPNFERIYELKPDVILIGGRQLEQFDELNRIAPTVFVDQDPARFWRSFRANLELLGEIFAREEQLEKRLAALEARIAALNGRAAASGLRALILLVNDGALSVYGPNSRFGIIHQDFGFAASDDKIELGTHGMNISFEYLVRTNPDLIFVIDRAAVAGGSIWAQQVLDNPLVAMTAAAENGRIVYLNSEAWYVAAGGLEAMEIMLADVEQAFPK